MPNFRDQLRQHYEPQALSAEKVDEILNSGRAAAAGGGAAQTKIASFPKLKRQTVALALAAVLALIVGLGTWFAPRHPAPASFAALAPAVVEFFRQPPKLARQSQDKAELRRWLLAQGAPPDYQLPARLAALDSEGCQVLDVQGRPAYLTCFWRQKAAGQVGGELIHLLTAHRRDFPDAPSSPTPQWRELEGWNFASWAEDEVAYTLAAAAPVEVMRPFLATSPAPGSSETALAVLSF